MIEAGSSAELAVEARDPASEATAIRRSLAILLGNDADTGLSAAFELLAREPRIKPSRGLVIDPGEQAWRGWSQRVAAGAALIESAAIEQVFDEVRDELSDSPELAADVLAVAEPHPSLTAERRKVLLQLGVRP